MSPGPWDVVAPRKVTDDELRAALAASASIREAARAVGRSASWVIRRLDAWPDGDAVRAEIAERGRPERRRRTSVQNQAARPGAQRYADAEMVAALRESTSVSDAARRLGVAPGSVTWRAQRCPEALEIIRAWGPARRRRRPPVAAEPAAGRLLRAALALLAEHLGSQAAVARALGITRQRVSQIITESDDPTRSPPP